jgi:hypothetical protein
MRSINPIPKICYVCSWITALFISVLLYASLSVTGAWLISLLGRDRYFSFGLSRDALPLVIFISVLIGGITAVLVFPPAKIHSWFYPTKNDLPRYGLSTYSLSCCGSVMAGFILSIIFLTFLAISSVSKDLSRSLSDWVSAISLISPTHMLNGLVFSLLFFGLVLTPHRANWIIRWIYKDFWDSKP